jgi:hypothetical protein
VRDRSIRIRRASEPRSGGYHEHSAKVGKYVSGKTRDEVKEKYLALTRPPDGARSPLRCQRWLAIWRAGWPMLSAQLSPRRRRQIVRFSAGCHIIAGIGSKRLDKLSVRDVQIWLNRLREQCQCCAKERTPDALIRDVCDRSLLQPNPEGLDSSSGLRGALSQAVRDELRRTKSTGGAPSPSATTAGCTTSASAPGWPAPRSA